MSSDSSTLIVLQKGKADNGKAATMAFSCGLSALALGHDTTVFLTSDGSVWGYPGSSNGIAVQGFPPLDEMISDYIANGGKLLLCSVCHKTCSIGGPESPPATEMLPTVALAGMATMVDLASHGACITF